MAFFTWSDSYSVNIQEIDEQHKKLIALLNKLFEAMSIGKGREVVGPVLKEVIDYTVYHFGTEERLFQLYGYPKSASHKKAHDELTRQAKELKQSVDAGKKLVTVEVMNFLKEWLYNHILEEDKQYTSFLNNKGVK